MKREPSLEAIAAKLADWTGKTPPHAGKDAAFDQIARLFAMTFQTAAGQEVLEVIFDMSVRRPLPPSLLADPIQAADRQGQNQLALAILTYVTHGKQLEANHGRHKQFDDRDGDNSGGYADSGPFVAVN